MRNHYKRTLFPVTLYHTNVRENSVIQREVLASIQRCYEEKELPIPDGWLTDKLTTSFDRDELNHKIFESEKIHELYVKYVSSVFDKPVSFSLEDMWFNYYIDGEYQEEHHHINPTPFFPPVHFSCVHYLNLIKRSTQRQHFMIQFRNYVPIHLKWSRIIVRRIGLRR